VAEGWGGGVTAAAELRSATHAPTRPLKDHLGPVTRVKKKKTLEGWWEGKTAAAELRSATHRDGDRAGDGRRQSGRGVRGVGCGVWA